MPHLNILTWNSNGESGPKAVCLQQLLAQLAIQQPPFVPDVIFIQEANAGQAGPIFNLLNGPGNYQNRVSRIGEGGQNARAYLMAWSARVNIVTQFQAVSLAQDIGVTNWIANTFNLNTQGLITQDIAGARNLAFANVTVNGSPATVATWHAPRGPSRMGLNNLPGGANPDAYLALEQANFYNGWNQPAPGAASILAGDLNIRGGNATMIPVGNGQHELLANWEGYHNGLDFVIANLTNAVNGNVTGGEDHGDCGSDHSIVTARVDW